MKKKKYYLAAGTIACSAFCGLATLSQNTYANDSPDPDANHAAVMEVVDNYETEIGGFIQTNYPEYWAAGTPLKEAGDEFAPYYKPTSLNAVMKLFWGYGFALQFNTPTDIPDGYSENIDEQGSSFFTTHGFTEYEFHEHSNKEFINNDTGVICYKVVGVETIGCSHIDEWQISSEWQSFINSIGTAYHKAEEEYPTLWYKKTDYASDPNIINSEYEPYQYVEVPMKEFYGLFYRQSPTSEWVYFAGTQMIMSCDAFTGEAQKGFAGLVCLNGDERSRVAVETEDEEESDVKVPDTGDFTLSDRGLIAGISAAVLGAASIAVYIIRYFAKRQNAKVHFGKH